MTFKHLEIKEILIQFYINTLDNYAFATLLKCENSIVLPRLTSSCIEIIEVLSGRDKQTSFMRCHGLL
jgi:hypothetical protein